MADNISLTLGLTSAFAFATAILYIYVGNLTIRRETSGVEARRALVLFAVWWYGLGVVSAIGGISALLGALGNLDLDLHLALTYIVLVPLVALLWGLLYYLLFIYTGNARLFWPVTWFNVALLAGLFYVIVWLHPTSVRADPWAITFTYEREASGWIGALFSIAFLGPVLFAAIGYGTLLFRTDDPTTRYRVGLVSGAFVLWFGSAAIAAATNLQAWFWWPPVSRIVQLVSTIMVILAYKPPRGLRERYGLEGVERRARDPGFVGRKLLPVAVRLQARVLRLPAL